MAGLMPDFAEALADGNKQFFFSDEIQAKLARRLNAIINIPFISNKKELQIILKVVQSLDRNTFKFLPKEILEVALDKRKGLPGNFLDALKENLPALLISAIPFPFLPLLLKQGLVGGFVNLLIEALREGRSLPDLLPD